MFVFLMSSWIWSYRFVFGRPFGLFSADIFLNIFFNSVSCSLLWTWTNNFSIWAFMYFTMSSQFIRFFISCFVNGLYLSFYVFFGPIILLIICSFSLSFCKDTLFQLRRLLLILLLFYIFLFLCCLNVLSFNSLWYFQNCSFREFYRLFLKFFCFSYSLLCQVFEII